MKHAALPLLLLALEAALVAGRSTAAENGQLSLEMVAPRMAPSGSSSTTSESGDVVDPFAHKGNLMDDLDATYNDPVDAPATQREQPRRLPVAEKRFSAPVAGGRPAPAATQQQQNSRSSNWLQRAQADMQNLMGAAAPRPLAPLETAADALRQGNYADATGGVVAAIASARSQGAAPLSQQTQSGQQLRSSSSSSPGSTTATQGTGNPFDSVGAELGPASFADLHMALPGGDAAPPSTEGRAAAQPLNTSPAAAIDLSGGGNSLQMAAPPRGFLAQAAPLAPSAVAPGPGLAMPQIVGAQGKSMLERAREEEKNGVRAGSVSEAAGILGMKLPSAFSQSSSFGAQQSPNWPWQQGSFSSSSSNSPQAMQTQSAPSAPGMRRMDQLLQPLAFRQEQSQAQAQAEAQAQMRRQAEQQAQQQARAQALAQAIAASSIAAQPQSFAQSMMVQAAPEPMGIPGMAPPPGGGFPGMAPPAPQQLMAQPMGQPMFQPMAQPFAQPGMAQSMAQTGQLVSNSMGTLGMSETLPAPSAATWWPAPQQALQQPQMMQQLPAAQLQQFLEAPTQAPSSWAGPSLLGLLGAQPVFAAETDPPRVSPWMVMPDVGGSSMGGMLQAPAAQSESFFGGQQQPQMFVQQPQMFVQQPQFAAQQPQGDGSGCVLCKTQKAQEDGGRWKNYFSKSGDHERTERLSGDDSS